MKALENLRQTHGLPAEADNAECTKALAHAIATVDFERIAEVAEALVTAMAGFDDSFAELTRANARLDAATANVDRSAAKAGAHAARAEAAAETRIAISRMHRWLLGLGYDVDDGGVIYVHSENVATLTTAIGEVNERLAIASTAVGLVASEFRGVHEADLDAVRHCRDAMVRQRTALLEERDQKLLNGVR